MSLDNNTQKHADHHIEQPKNFFQKARTVTSCECGTCVARLRVGTLLGSRGENIATAGTKRFETPSLNPQISLSCHSFSFFPFFENVANKHMHSKFFAKRTRSFRNFSALLPTLNIHKYRETDSGSFSVVQASAFSSKLF